MLALQCSIAGLQAKDSSLGSSVAVIKISSVISKLISSISVSLENGKQERVRLKGNETNFLQNHFFNNVEIEIDIRI